MTWRATSTRPNARHIITRIDTHFSPHVMRRSHPMTWRAMSARPYRVHLGHDARRRRWLAAAVPPQPAAEPRAAHGRDCGRRTVPLHANSLTVRGAPAAWPGMRVSSISFNPSFTCTDTPLHARTPPYRSVVEDTRSKRTRKMTHRQGERSCRREDSVRRFKLRRMLDVNSRPARARGRGCSPPPARVTARRCLPRPGARAWQISLAASQDAKQLTTRGFKLHWMTWQC
jgi:hypothetical protein